ncbi:MAG: hypothetical protein GC185_04560 [Alphaproteobacteria bacterium]|nr:hypothetical protein [Alphaproteobacteria bacterium]
MTKTASVRPGGTKNKTASARKRDLDSIFTGKSAFIFAHDGAGKRKGETKDLMSAFFGAKPETKQTKAQKPQATSAADKNKLPAKQLKKPAPQRHPASLGQCFRNASHHDEQHFYGDLEHVLSALLALDGMQRLSAQQKFCLTEELSRRLLMKMMQPGKAYLSTRFKAKARGIANRKSPRAEIRIRTHKSKRHRKHMAPPRPKAFPAPQPRL